MRFENRSWKTGTRAIWAASGAALIAAVVIYGAGGPTGVGDQLVDAVIFSPVFIAFCRLGGIPAAQPFVEISQDGIAYGKRQFIPWAVVTGVDWTRRGLD